MKDGYRVAVVGATGAVGNEMVKVLEQRKFPVASLRVLASARSRRYDVAPVVAFQVTRTEVRLR